MLVKEKLNRYQKGITLHTKSREVRCLCGFPALCLLFKLNNNVLAAAVFICFIHVFIVFIIYII